MRRRSLILVLCVLVLGLLPAAASATFSGGSRSGRFVTATLVNTSGDIVGSARFFERRDGRVVVQVRVSGLEPGLHGLHVHAVGACSPTFAAAGGHFNPTGEHHGHHAGDLGNIVANSNGKAVKTLVTAGFTLSPGPLSVFDADGSALVVHAGEDDLVSDPAGNSGARVACGVIGD